MARRRGRRGGVILGIETSCDETAAALVTRDGDVLANVVASQAELHAPFGGVVPEVAARRHLELVSPVVEEALRDADATLGDVELVAATRGPGLVGRAARRSVGGQGARLGAVAAARRRRPPARTRRVALPPSRPGRAPLRVPARHGWSHDGARGERRTTATRCSAARSTTRPVRPSTRARGCSGSVIPAAPSWNGSPAAAMPTRSRSRSRASTASTSRSPA